MAKELDEIFYAAIRANETLVSMTGGRIYSTCIEVPPTKEDNTPVPYLIITDDPFTNDLGSKDSIWESMYDNVKSSVIISARSPKEVRLIRRLVREAIAAYVGSMEDEAPELVSSSNEGIAWDWMKPCFYDTLHYQCDIHRILTEEDNEQEDPIQS